MHNKPFFILEPRKRMSACIVLSHYCRSLNAFDVGGKCVRERMPLPCELHKSQSVLKRFRILGGSAFNCMCFLCVYLFCIDSHSLWSTLSSARHSTRSRAAHTRTHAESHSSVSLTRALFSHSLPLAAARSHFEPPALSFRAIMQFRFASTEHSQQQTSIASIRSICAVCSGAS